MVAGVKRAGKSERLVLPQSSAGALCLSVESASTGPCSPPRPPEEAVPCFATTVMIPRLQAHARDMACLRAAFNVFFYPQRLVTQELQRGMRATALVSVSFLFSCPDAVELELVRVRGHGPFRLTHRSLGVITYKKKEGCPDDKRDEDQTKEMNISSQQVSISQDLRAPKAAYLKPSSAPKTARATQNPSTKTSCFLFKASQSPSRQRTT